MVNQSSRAWDLGRFLLLALIWGCQAQEGMFCQQQSDCNVGLICTKPSGSRNPQGFGLCEPARRGAGETCLRSADCQSGLRCSNEVGMFNGDERHGICQVKEVPQDGGTAMPDQAQPSPPDLSQAVEDLRPAG